MLRDIYDRLHDATREIQKLRDALAKYADHNNWVVVEGAFADTFIGPTCRPGWKIAEEALEDES